MLKDNQWKILEVAEARALLGEWLSLSDAQLPRDVSVEAVSAQLGCYVNLHLVRLTSPIWSTVGDLYALWDGDSLLIALDGTSAPIHAANERVRLALDAQHVLDYVRFFCFAVRGADGPFLLLEHAGDPEESPEVGPAKLARPLQLLDPYPDGRFRVAAVVSYAEQLFAAEFAVSADGGIEMLDDKPLAQQLDADDLPRAADFASPDEVMAQLAALPAALAVTGSAPVTPPIEPLRALVELLLERALRDKAKHRLLENFNASMVGINPLEQFASLLTKGFPVVAVESTVPFVEEAIAEIVNLHCKPADKIAVMTAEPTPHDDSIVWMRDMPSKGVALILLPLFVYRQLAYLDRVVHQLGTRDLAVLIACDNVRSLPESLRQMVDVTLRLPQIDSVIFQTLFTRVIGSAPPAGWDADGGRWVRHLLHTDFDHPRRLSLTPGKAFDYIKAEVTERLSAVEVVQGLGLKDLHGLTEAREFAEDLIVDIHAAIRGELEWEKVDRGALMVGPPGTGKTTLARAIAKDCGVRFLTASAATWMSTGEHLGHHIRAIRATFAEARRYSPSILFIDEIDGLGNRDNFSGKNAQYLTEVVNAVLEQMQGIDPEMPVFVIAATNHLHNVDPALRRSGRLDRIIQIPLPGTDALELIYKHYIEKLCGQGTDASVDRRALAGLSVGLTAADVEKIVRGAQRRARKVNRPVGQVDLIAELTNKPRSDQGSLRMSPAEIERTAVHESGHALAQYLSATRGSAIGFVTVIPRSDGSLGFVASMPDARNSLTRQDYLEKIEVCMGGRAAEHIRYGEHGVSGGASSDLAVATQIATTMVLRLAFGGDRRFSVSEVPSAAQQEQIETLLNDAYQSILRKFAAHEASLNHLAATLITRQELTGDEVRGLLA